MVEDWEAPENLDRLARGELRVGDFVKHADPVLWARIEEGRAELVMGTIVGEGRLPWGLSAWIVECVDGQRRAILKGEAVALGVAGAQPG